MKHHIQEIQHNLFFGNKYINIQNIQDFFFFLKEKPNKNTSSFLCIVYNRIIIFNDHFPTSILFEIFR